MPYQSAVTIRAPLRPGSHDAAVAALAGLQASVTAGGSALSGLDGVHFARFTLLPAVTLPDGTDVAETLLYMADVDGSQRSHLRELACFASAELDTAFGCCLDYPPGSSARERHRWLCHHTLASAAAYVNAVGRSSQEIVDDARLRDALENYLDAHHGELAAASAVEVHRRLRGFVGATASLTFAISEPPAPPLWWRARSKAVLLTVLFLLGLASPLLLIGLPFWLIALRRHERSDVVFTDLPDPAALEQLRAQEDHVAYNPFIAVGSVRPGLFRRITIRAVLGAINLAARHVFNHESLAGVTTIHFARWVYLDDRKRVFFASHYDGSLESYMDDFIDKVAWGLNAVFGNGLGYPRTRWLFLDGARQEELFKNYLRCHQLLTQVTYSAYPDLSASNINNNAQVRLGLTQALDEEEASRWLARL
ncbi:MAG: hypothetical protein QOK10_101 [Pseudonocardiales bacterium]|jgi:hypothetical protein|nr:hypothetical protein [Pseudonocardiales bacterium]